MSDKDLELELLKKVLETSETTRNSISEIGKSLSDLDKKVDLHIQESKFEFAKIKETNEVQNLTMSQYNEVLKEHHQRSTELKRDNDLKEEKLRSEIFGEKGLERRVASLEEPAKFRNKLNNYLVKIGGAAAGIYAVIELLKALNILK